MKYLFLDFDGVLFDTLKEAYIICRYAFNGTNYNANIDSFIYDKFYRYKFLVYNSWQYYYIMQLLKENLSDEEFISKYYEYMNNRDKISENSFDEKYYSARNDLMKNHNEFWDNLEKPFEFLYMVKKGVKDKLFVPIIVSKKNKSAIEYRLKQSGFEIDSDSVFGKDELFNYKTKPEFINEYMNKNNIKNSYFIDDNSNNLLPCREYPNIKPILAGWGNIAIGEKGYSQEECINLLLSN